MPNLVIHDVSKVFQSVGGPRLLVLDGINLEISDGEFVALVGPSGCGKTTLLRMIQGLETPSSGQILIGADLVIGPGHDCGFVFQQYGLLPWLTATQNIGFALEAKGVPKAQRSSTAERVLELVGLKGFGDRYPHQLSGGMQQRVGIARALAIEPEMMLLDEPFGALDALTREILQNELLALTERMGKTILFVTHSVDEAVHLADRVIVMSPRPGRIREIVPIEIPRPRVALGEAIRETPEYIHKRRMLWDQLLELV